MKSVQTNVKNYLVIILLFITISFIKILLSLKFYSPYIMWDETLYDNIAQNVLNCKLYSQFIFLDGNYPPGYSILLSVAYVLSSDKNIVYHLMLIINALLTSSIIFPSYFILKKYCSKHVSMLGSMLIAVLPSVTLYSFTLWSENLFIPLFAFSVWFLIESYETNNKVWEFLASLSVVYLYVTRSTGLAMICGFILSFIFYLYVNRKQENILTLIKKKWFLLASFAILLSCWLIYTTYFIPTGNYSFGSPYQDGNVYAQKVASAFIDLGVLFSYILFSINHIDYLLVSSYFLLFFVLLYYIKLLINREKQSIPLLVTYTYFIVSSIILLIITCTFIFGYSQVTNLDIYGRYVEPIIPLIFLFGIIGIERSLNEKIKFNLSTILVLLIFAVTVIVTVLTIPRESMFFVDVFSTYYLQTISEPIMVDALIIILSLITLALLYLSTINRKFIYILLTIFIFSSVIYSISPYEMEVSLSNYPDPMISYLENHSNSNTLIIMNYSDFKSDGYFTWGLATFWNKGKILLVSNITDYMANSTVEKPDYIISNKLIPYENVASGRPELTPRYDLYSIGPVNDSINLPYTLDISSNDTYYIDGFSTSNNVYRWTTNSSAVLVKFPKSLGDMHITINTVGFRPEDDPAHAVFYINGNKIGEEIKPAGNFSYSFVVPAVYLNECYQILEIDTNPWRPCDYGLKDDTLPGLSKDDRFLGIAIESITINNTQH